MIVKKFTDIRDQLLQEANREYYNSKQNTEEQITFEQYEEMLQQINYDVAWQIFDEVNTVND